MQTTQMHGAPGNTISSNGMGIYLFLPEREINPKMSTKEAPQDHLQRVTKTLNMTLIALSLYKILTEYFSCHLHE